MVILLVTVSCAWISVFVEKYTISHGIVRAVIRAPSLWSNLLRHTSNLLRLVSVFLQVTIVCAGGNENAGVNWGEKLFRLNWKINWITPSFAAKRLCVRYMPQMSLKYRWEYAREKVSRKSDCSIFSDKKFRNYATGKYLQVAISYKNRTFRYARSFSESN